MSVSGCGGSEGLMEATAMSLEASRALERAGGREKGQKLFPLFHLQQLFIVGKCQRRRHICLSIRFNASPRVTYRLSLPPFPRVPALILSFTFFFNLFFCIHSFLIFPLFFSPLSLGSFRFKYRLYAFPPSSPPIVFA